MFKGKTSRDGRRKCEFVPPLTDSDKFIRSDNRFSFALTIKIKVPLRSANPLLGPRLARIQSNALATGSQQANSMRMDKIVSAIEQT